MSTHSLVDDILRSLSHLPTPAQASTTQFNATASSTSYTRDQQSPPKASNPLSTLAPSASQDAKSLFLTLHFSFPNELLPALDLLDRSLVTRLVASKITSTKDPTSTANVPDTNTTVSADPAESEVFYVQSASAATSQHHPKHSSITTGAEPQGRFRDALASSSKGKGSGARTYYEVRLDSWNCSCAAFAFSSFTCLTKEDEDHRAPVEGAYGTAGAFQDVEEGIADDASKHTAEWRFGGTLTLPNATAGVPVCKHILAAVMARAAPKLFVDGVHVNVKRELGKEEMAGWGAGWGD